MAFGSKENGFAGIDTEYTFNSPLHVKHIQQLADWQKDKIFVYGGRRNIGNPKFIQGECAMYTESSAGYGGFKAGAKFEFGAANLPYWPDVKGAPQNTIIGGASLWVMGGHSADAYKGVSKFVTFLSLPMVQAYWHANTGYVPITTAAYDLMKKVKYYKAVSVPRGRGEGLSRGDHRHRISRFTRGLVTRFAMRYRRAHGDSRR